MGTEIDFPENTHGDYDTNFVRLGASRIHSLVDHDLIV